MTHGPLHGLRVLDLTRILAGPSATQIMADLGADVIKVEKPREGDDTRKWGPPFLKDAQGRETTESAYYLSANRGKRSVSIDFTRPEGQALLRRLLSSCDVLFENFKPGTLDKYGLGYAQLKTEYPGLVYCSLSGFGQTGPWRDRAGYDFLVQGLGGIMSLTGPADGAPYKVGVAVADLMAGMYALTGILAALHHKQKTGQGQYVDISLLDTQLAWLSNAGQYYLTGGAVTPRMGNAHPTIVPYEAFAAQDGHVILAVGNDRQFADFCAFAGRPEIAADPRFAKNADRVRHRGVLVPLVAEIIAARPRAHWIQGLEPLGVPCGPVNDLAQAFALPPVHAREMTVEVPHPATPDPVRLIGTPLKFSETPATVRAAPPTLGQHTEDVLTDLLRLTRDEIDDLRNKGAI